METNNDTQLPLDQLRQIRIEKIEKIKQLGFDPFASTPKYQREAIVEVKNHPVGENVSISGRITASRSFGKLTFIDLEDYSGKFQIAIKAGILIDAESQLTELLDVGDFIEVQGKTFETKTGELTVEVKKLNLLTKSVRPLPSRHFGLKDEEERYRQRYVDFVLNPGLREMFEKKSIFWRTMREFLQSNGFLEVETPVLENATGGADASPFVTHHNALDIDVYLRISMGELWQKRLMVGGFEKTFEIGRQFRNEGMSREHLQDYSQVEFYWAYADYEDSMRLVEEMYKKVAMATFSTLQFTIDKFDVNLASTWEHIDYGQIIKQKYEVDIEIATEDELKTKLREAKISFDAGDQKGRLLDLLWKSIRKDIAGPAFLVGHPVEVSPLAKRLAAKPSTVQRYQVILAGSEMGNGYSELNDPIDQAQRFQTQQQMRDAGDDEAQMQDTDFVRALEYGMPPVTGFGISERLFSFLANKSIRECVMFPLLKPETDVDIVEVNGSADE